MLSFIHEYASQKLMEHDSFPVSNRHAHYYASHVARYKNEQSRLFYYKFRIELSNLIRASEQGQEEEAYKTCLGSL